VSSAFNDIFKVWRVQGRHPINYVRLSSSTLQVVSNRKARTQAFAALQEAFKHLHRGDELIVIPVTGDAVTEGQGQILRLQECSEQRGRMTFRLEKTGSGGCRQNCWKKLQSDAAAKPYSKSDILGAVDNRIRGALKFRR